MTVQGSIGSNMSREENPLNSPPYLIYILPESAAHSRACRIGIRLCTMSMPQCNL